MGLISQIQISHNSPIEFLVRVKRWGKSPPRRQQCSLAVRLTGCKTVYTDN